MKRTSIRAKSKKRIEKDREYNALGEYLFKHRAHCCCELCGKSLVDYKGTRHHIQKRSSIGGDTSGNLLILCTVCHMRADNPNSSMTINGIENAPFTVTEQLGIAGKEEAGDI